MSNFCPGWNISFGRDQSELVYPATVRFLPDEIANAIRTLPREYPILEVYISWKAPLLDTVHGWAVAEHGGKVPLLTKAHDRIGHKACSEIATALAKRNTSERVHVE